MTHELINQPEKGEDETLFDFTYQMDQKTCSTILQINRLYTLARTDLLYMLNWGTQLTMGSYLKKIK